MELTPALIFEPGAADRSARCPLCWCSGNGWPGTSAGFAVLTALCDVLLFWDELFYCRAFRSVRCADSGTVGCHHAAAFRLYYKQGKG